jgi:hypothetical protein
MVISYTYLTCWCMKSMFYECQHRRPPPASGHPAPDLLALSGPLQAAPLIGRPPTARRPSIGSFCFTNLLSLSIDRFDLISGLTVPHFELVQLQVGKEVSCARAWCRRGDRQGRPGAHQGAGGDDGRQACGGGGRTQPWPHGSASTLLFSARIRLSSALGSWFGYDIFSQLVWCKLQIYCPY